MTPDTDRTATAAEPGAVLRGRYMLEEPLEHGRFGVVYRAVDQQAPAGRASHVSLLVLPPEVAASEQLLEAVRWDLRRLRSLTHPHILGVFDLDNDGDRHFVTMESVDGESLRTVLDHMHPERLAENDALAVLHAVGTALELAHAYGIAHGDVRAENIVVSSALEVKLSFIPACLLRRAPFCAAPSDDVYGLGCLAYELLCGARLVGSLYTMSASERRAALRRLKHLSRRRRIAIAASLAPHNKRTRNIAKFLADLQSTTSRSSPARALASPRGVAVRAASLLLLVSLTAAVAYLADNGLQRIFAPEGMPDTRVPDAIDDADPIAEEPSEPTPQEKQFSANDGALSQMPAAAEPATAQTRAAAATLGSVAGRTSANGSASAVLAAPERPVREAAAGAVTFAAREVIVPESQGAVRLEIRRRDGVEPIAVAWWTSDGTAVAGEDYAELGAVIETFDYGEQSRIIQIPILSNRVPENDKFFYVNLREDDETAAARRGVVARVRVTIVDDDL